MSDQNNAIDDNDKNLIPPMSDADLADWQVDTLLYPQQADGDLLRGEWEIVHEFEWREGYEYAVVRRKRGQG